jgi:iron-sulfur cluster assembly accessory protein
VALKNNPQLYLRVFVDAGGCSGFSYQFELDDTPLASDDVLFRSGDNRLVIDEASLGMMRGSTIDYVQEMIKSSFQVTNNPQSESACGCGSSFALKNFASNPAID